MSLKPPKTREAIVGFTSAPSTTSVSFVDMDEMEITATTDGVSLISAVFSGTFNHSEMADTSVILDLDGSNVTASRRGMRAFAGTDDFSNDMNYPLVGLKPGSHTFKIQWKTNGGTLSAVGVERSFQLI